jgi:hypothetical protein
METKTGEENQIIAEFMGDRENILRDPKWKSGDEVVYLKYHSSWDWLMPVVEKICDLSYDFHIHIMNHQRKICHVGVDTWNGTPIIHQENELSINAVYNVVIEFIKWHNNKPQTL